LESIGPNNGPSAAPILDRLADLVRDAIAAGDLGLAEGLIAAQRRSAPATPAKVERIEDARARRK
jgi:hypothetical protein